MLDIPGGFGKAPAQQSHISRDDGGGWRVVDRSGRAHAYPDEG
jgi:hypothetical protein